jgi:choline kinase
MKDIIKSIHKVKKDITLEFLAYFNANEYFEGRMNEVNNSIEITPFFRVTEKSNESLDDYILKFSQMDVDGIPSEMMDITFFTIFVNETAYVLRELLNIFLSEGTKIYFPSFFEKVLRKTNHGVKINTAKDLQKYLNSFVDTVVTVLQEEYPDAV